MHVKVHIYVDHTNVQVKYQWKVHEAIGHILCVLWNRNFLYKVLFSFSELEKVETKLSRDLDTQYVKVINAERHLRSEKIKFESMRRDYEMIRFDYLNDCCHTLIDLILKSCYLLSEEQWEWRKFQQQPPTPDQVNIDFWLVD